MVAGGIASAYIAEGHVDLVPFLWRDFASSRPAPVPCAEPGASATFGDDVLDFRRQLFAGHGQYLSMRGWQLGQR
jgi:hypothetical protein